MSVDRWEKINALHRGDFEAARVQYGVVDLLMTLKEYPVLLMLSSRKPKNTLYSHD